MKLTFNHFIILQVLDILTTYYGLTYLGLVENNPIANNLFGNYGIISVLILGKIIMLVFVYGCLQIYSLKIKKFALYTINIMFMFVILNNLYWMCFV